MRRKGFTLLEVIIAVAIIGMVVAGGFKLITISLRTLFEVREEQALINAAQKVHLEFLTKNDMPDQGEKDGIKWSVNTDSVPTVKDLELTFRRLTVKYNGREMSLYLPSE